jgi:AcrR family transcriptional regulator
MNAGTRAPEGPVAASAAAGEPARRRPGRPRDAGADDAILGAVVELLVEVGFGGLTIDAVAQRAGVGKATIYRRWDGKERLVLDALAVERKPVEVPDTGTLRGDLLAFYLPMIEPVAQQTAVRLMPALAAEAAVSPELADRLRSFIADRRAPAMAVMERGRDRGEIAADADLDLCIDQLTGALVYRLFFTGEPVTAEVVERAVSLVLRGAAP